MICIVSKQFKVPNKTKYFLVNICKSTKNKFSLVSENPNKCFDKDLDILEIKNNFSYFLQKEIRFKSVILKNINSIYNINNTIPVNLSECTHIKHVYIDGFNNFTNEIILPEKLDFLEINFTQKDEHNKTKVIENFKKMLKNVKSIGVLLLKKMHVNCILDNIDVENTKINIFINYIKENHLISHKISNVYLNCTNQQVMFVDLRDKDNKKQILLNKQSSCCKYRFEEINYEINDILSNTGIPFLNKYVFI